MIRRHFFNLGIPPERRKGNFIWAEELLGKMDFLPFRRGQSLGRLPDDTIMTVKWKPGEPFTADVIANIHWDIIGADLAQKLENIGVNSVELLEMPITTVDGVPVGKKFYAINVLTRIDALSEKTVRFPNGAIIKAVIVDSKVPKDLHVFSLKDEMFGTILDDVAKDALCELPHDGLEFLPLEQE